MLVQLVENFSVLLHAINAALFSCFSSTTGYHPCWVFCYILQGSAITYYHRFINV